MNRLPAALFIVDIQREHIAVAEAKKLGIPTFAIVDTNSNPSDVDFAIPANDDATRSIEKIMTLVCDSIQEGLSERGAEKDAKEAKEEKAPATEDKKTDSPKKKKAESK
jgi:small subunit ribosomal protein S2